MRRVVHERDRHKCEGESGGGRHEVGAAIAEVEDQLHERDEDEKEGPGQQHQAGGPDGEEAPRAQRQPQGLQGDGEVLPRLRRLDAIECEGAQHQDHEDDAIPTRSA